MMPYEQTKKEILAHPMAWLITRVAGFIGANLLESLLRLNQRVIGLDNFAAVTPANLEQVKREVPKKQWAQFTFVEGDICDVKSCRRVCEGVESLQPFFPHIQSFKPTHRGFQPGDVRDSQADLTKATRLLGYKPAYTIRTGLNTALKWYMNNL